MTDQEKQSYIAHRDGIISVLDSLKWYWDLAEGVSAMIASSYVTPEMIESIEMLLQDSMESAENEVARQKIQSGINRLASLRQQEKDEIAMEKEEVEQSVFTNYNF